MSDANQLLALCAEMSRDGDHAGSAKLRAELAELHEIEDRPGDAAIHHLSACHGFVMAGDAAAARACLGEAKRLLPTAHGHDYLYDIVRQRETQVRFCEDAGRPAPPNPAPPNPPCACKPGDTVFVKSGGPAMKVAALVTDRLGVPDGPEIDCAECEWPGEKGPQKATFPLDCLQATAPAV